MDEEISAMTEHDGEPTFHEAVAALEQSLAELQDVLIEMFWEYLPYLFFVLYAYLNIMVLLVLWGIV